MKNIFLLLITSFVLLACSPSKSAVDKQEQSVKDQTTPSVHTVAFYNVENLFDTEDDPNTFDDDFTPNGKQKWTIERYEQKIKKLAKVISSIGDEDGAEMIGVCEIENEKVLIDLINDPLLKQYGYKYVHYDSPDERGIDVAFLYKESIFEVTFSKNYEAKLPDNDKTRDVLLVSGKLQGEQVNFVVNHWSSRGGGEEKSAPKRMISALVARQIVDDLEAENPNAKVLLMGDFNDEPFNESITKGLQAIDMTELKDKQLFNTLASLTKQGRGTYNYKGDWNMLDQIIITKGFLNANKTKSWIYVKGDIYEPDYLKETTGKYKGNPFRMYAGTNYLGGYSDHFPIYVHLERQ